MCPEMVEPLVIDCSRTQRPLRVYVAAPYQRAGLVRALMALTPLPTVQWTARWPLHARGPERLETLSRAEQQRLAAGNDEDLAGSHVVLAIAFPGEGGEMFTEIGRALLHGIPVVWTGSRRTLSAAREGVLFVDEIDAAVELLAELAELARVPGGDDAWTRRRIWASFEATQREVGHHIDHVGREIARPGSGAETDRSARLDRDWMEGT